MNARNLDTSQFDEIRPYRDDEVRPALRRLIEDPEMSRVVAHFLLPGMAGKLERPLAWLVRQLVRFEFRNANNVRGVQDVIAKYLEKAVNRTSCGLSISGLDTLPKDRACLFVSNHRDIAMDPALAILAMYKEGHETSRIAIGDNLLSKQFATDIMKLNKCFVVKRSSGSRREKLMAATTLSRYIHHSIVNENEHVWIAQRAGRAKDGRDRTNPALAAMFGMAKPKEQSFAEFWRELHIVPLSISYEWDPCDRYKARELYITEHQDEYQKQAHEDLGSIAKGVVGHKGHVHAAFGTPIEKDFNDVTALADEIDRQIIGNYVLHPTNLIAYQMIYGEAPQLPVGYPPKPWHPDEHQEIREKFEQRMAAIDERWRDKAIQGYANPVVSRLAYEQ
ncbi:1-acyl-sn-glycerol-3-phosphate acyltransferase [Microbulbifer hydrolyticus]|uniref:Acyltransferase n=1 Tax=Microbulbifer hydrolyticus TaxID=48074 RepID=A0A6P1TAF4_9GAMM|nr:1-acyl-sn-glycerol-3-phosphate acyltransferase [Microbulbifer hydrolyticus]MBB5212066.1 1-acyl-sn-glycerol-3-phosphate acyltransferase [Microbulbifer hydrolyticus]QHQ39744.1 acyltransferase [Microbulbifer hydrolyticus]